jgi:hypothetical protein
MRVLVAILIAACAHGGPHETLDARLERLARHAAAPCPPGTMAQFHPFFSHSLIAIVCERSDGTRQGPTMAFTLEMTPALRGAYQDGKRTGRWTQLAENGDPIVDGSYVNGRRTGAWTWWWPRGSGGIDRLARMRTGGYIDGMPDGAWLETDWNGEEIGGGQLARGSGHWHGTTHDGHVVDGQCESDLRDGRWSDTSEQEVLTMTFRAGVADGPLRVERGGTILSQGVYVAGKRDGPWVEHFGSHEEISLTEGGGGRMPEETRVGSYRAGEAVGEWKITIDNMTSSTAPDTTPGDQFVSATTRLCPVPRDELDGPLDEDVVLK